MLHGRRSKVAVHVYAYVTSDTGAHVWPTSRYSDMIEIEGCDLG